MNDLCVYVEVDTMLDPVNPAFAKFGSKNKPDAPRVIRTKRLRGVYSQVLACTLRLASTSPPDPITQGLVLPLSEVLYYGIDPAQLTLGQVVFIAFLAVV